MDVPSYQLRRGFDLGVSNQFGEVMIGPGGVDQAWNFMHAMLSTRAGINP